MTRKLYVSDFKNWLSEQHGMTEFFSLRSPEEELVGKKVRSRVSENKLLEKIETDFDPVCVVQEFVEGGGEISAVDGKRYQIEVESGNFTVPRLYVKVKKD